jgi:alpha-tubulin suppressor-like RCC1 family protein
MVQESYYRKGTSFLEENNFDKAAMTFCKIGKYNDSKTKCSDFWSNTIINYNTISAGGYHTLGLRPDGTVIAVGNNDFHQCDISRWNDIQVISVVGNIPLV